MARLLLAALTVLLAVGCWAQHQATFPAGLNPQLCPNFPQCDNAILAAFSHLPLFKDPKLFNVGQAKYPPGINPQTCPNYPFCQSVLG